MKQYGIGLTRLGISASILAALVVASGACGDGGGSSGSSNGSGASGGSGGAGGADAVCGDGKVDPGEDCDDGTNNADTGACTSKCKNAACGDGFVQMGAEACDDGANNADTAACTSKCKVGICGDGLVQTGVEECDTGANNSDTGACTSMCKTATCGDSHVQSGVEQCDMGSNNDDTGVCTTMCKDAACGDGFVQAGVEACDEGAANMDTGSCTSMCKKATCGDSLVQAGVEGCDLGAANSDNGACTLACKSATCGDSLVQTGVEDCDLGAGNSDTGGCTSMCRSAKCGDGLVQTGVETCDMGPANSNTGACTLACKPAICGDGFVQMGVEQCDMGAGNSNTGACTLACKNAVCGDGFKGPGEACDDGNMTNADGCNIDCAVSGTPIFTQSYNSGNMAADIWYSVKLDPMGNIIVGGSAAVPGQGLNALVGKYDAMGNLLWIRSYNNPFNGDDEIQGVTADAQGNVIVVGYETLSATNANILVRKYDPAGTLIWSQSYNGAASLDDVGYGVATNAAGDIFMAAGVTVAAGTRDIVIAKLAGLNGSYTWSEQVNGAANNNDEGLAVAVDANANVYAAGYSVGALNNGDVWVRKYKDNGVTFSATWTRTYNGAGNGDDIAFGVTFDATGGLITTGYETATGQLANIWVRKYDAAGNVSWTQTYNDPSNFNDFGRSVVSDAAGNITVAGYDGQANGTFDVWLRKYDANGATRWTQTYNGNADQNDFGVGLAVDAGGFLFLAGAETTLAQGQNGLLRKYNP